MIKASPETRINAAAKKKVARKTNLSIPLREKEEFQELPQTRPKPVPFTCTRIPSDKRIETVTWAIKIAFCISYIIPQAQRTSQ